MSVLNAPPRLQPGETIRWMSLANHTAGRWRSAGGKLIVTDQRILFQPNRIDALLGGAMWECPLAAVTGVKTINRDRTVLAGGVRERLGIHTEDGMERFVVNDLQQKTLELRDLLGSSQG